MIAAVLEYSSKRGGLDCSIDEGFALRLPSRELVAGLGLYWTGRGAEYVDDSGRLIAFDPTANEGGPDALLVEQVLRTCCLLPRSSESVGL